MRLISFTNVRVFILLCALAFFSFVALHQAIHTRSWVEPLDVVILPISGDNHHDTDKYISSLSNSNLAEIETWFKREAKRYHLDMQEPVKIRLGPQVYSAPPRAPKSANFLAQASWSLRFRWWAFRNTPDIESSLTQVRMFVLFYQGQDNLPLRHSLGMKKGLLGLVHAFALHEQTAQNNIVIAHEMLHIVGAIDKYESSGAPIFPIGFADPARHPLFPQQAAEIMAGRIPVSHSRNYMAKNLDSVILNEFTAKEINWQQ